MESKKLLVTLAVSAVLFSGCGLKSRETIIKVNDTQIQRAQFDKMFNAQAKNTMLGQMGIKIDKKKNGFMYYLIQDRVVNELIVKALLEQEAEKRGIKVTEEDINGQIESLMAQVGGKNELAKILKQHDISQADFKNDVAQEIKMKRLAKDVGGVSVSDSEVKKYYDQNPDKFHYPDKVRASHILIEANPEAIREQLLNDIRYKNLDNKALQAKVDEVMKEREAKANEILAQVKATPDDFAKIAKENSQDKTTAINGGDLGFFAAKEMVPEFSKAAFALKPNTMTDKLVKTQYGYHIIKATDRMAASTQPFEKVKVNLKVYLENQKQVEVLDKLTESLKKQAKIEYVNDEFDPTNIQKRVEAEVDAAPKKIEEMEKKAAESKAKEEAKANKK